MNHELDITDERIEPITFDLACGSLVRIAMGQFWTKVSEADRRLGAMPLKYFGLRVYTNEGGLGQRMEQVDELFHGKDFEFHSCPKIWQWLQAHAASRNRFDHECVDDFLSAFEEAVDLIHSADEDMIEHLERLPAFVLPDAFDRIDDSIFNDQNH